MKTLQILIGRRHFLQSLATLPVILSGLYSKRPIANQERQGIPSVGYGVGAYGQNIYPGMSSNIYLPLVSKIPE